MRCLHVKGLIVVGEGGVASAALPPGRLSALLPIANRPLALHAFDTLRRSGAADVAFIAPGARLVELGRALVDAGADPRALRLIGTDVATTLAEAIRAAGDFLDGHRFIVHRADGIWTGSPEPLRQALTRPDRTATLFRQPLRRRRSAAVAGGGRAPEPEPETLEYELAGVHVFGPDSIDSVEALLQHADGEVVEDQWVTCAGAPDDLIAANRAALDELRHDGDLSGCHDCRIEGRVRIHPTARVSHSVLRGPVIVGAGALIESACLGPFIAVGNGAVVENSDVMASVLCEGCVVRDVACRIENSVVGPGAVVGGDFRLPKSVRLTIGAQASVNLA